MKKLALKLMISLVTLASLGISSMLPMAAVSAQDIDKNLQCGANLQFEVPPEGCPTDSSGISASERVDQIVTQIIDIMSLVVAVVAIIMIIIGGLRYITSGGDTGNVTGAKNTILYAIVGLIVVALAQVIVRFVVDRATLNTTTATSD